MGRKGEDVKARERAREQRNQRYERRRASAEERQRAQPLQTAGTAPSTPWENQPEASSPPQSVSARDKGKGREVPIDDQGNASHREGQAAAPVAASTSEALPQTAVRPLEISATFSPQSDVKDLIIQYLSRDPALEDILHALRNLEGNRDDALREELEHYQHQDGLLLFNNLVYVPNFETLCHEPS